MNESKCEYLVFGCCCCWWLAVIEFCFWKWLNAAWFHRKTNEWTRWITTVNSISARQWLFWPIANISLCPVDIDFRSFFCLFLWDDVSLAKQKQSIFRLTVVVVGNIFVSNFLSFNVINKDDNELGFGSWHLVFV